MIYQVGWGDRLVGVRGARRIDARAGAVTFADIAGRIELLRLECSKCERSGQYRVLRLMKECGRDATLLEWRARITADCPRRQAGNIHDACGARFPQLAALDQPRPRPPLRSV